MEKIKSVYFRGEIGQYSKNNGKERNLSYRKIFKMILHEPNKQNCIIKFEKF